MNIPFNKAKYRSESLVFARRLLNYVHQQKNSTALTPPASMILSFHPAPLKRVKALGWEKREGGWMSFYAPATENPKVGLYMVQMGAPAAVIQMENFIDMGVRNFISMGSAGGIQPHLEVRDVVVCSSALRDEGTSYHYKPKGEPAVESLKLSEKIMNRLKQYSGSVYKGRTWTTDALYRETEAEFLQYKKDGVLSVDMETSALYILASYYNVKCQSLMVVSDRMTSEGWVPDLFNKQVDEGLAFLCDVAVEMLDGIA